MNQISQSEFEILIGKGDEIVPEKTVIYFTAKWCGACKKINHTILHDNFSADWRLCDVDVNNYTAGYCGISSIPTFLLIKNKKIIGSISSSDTIKVLDWLKEKDRIEYL